MTGIIEINNIRYKVDWANPSDISIPLKFDLAGVNCFYAPMPQADPVIAGDFIGSTTRGGAVNFMNVRINPHGNGTHTECVGHISTEPVYLGDVFTSFLFLSELVSVFPQITDNGDKVIDRHHLEALIEGTDPCEALIVRTLPNEELKKSLNYSGTNPAYFTPEAIQWVVQRGYNHLLTDLPSIDKEEDGGVLAAHKAFWQYPLNTRKKSTITELIFVNNKIKDGVYLLDIQTLAWKLDVSPSRPVLYKLEVLP